MRHHPPIELNTRPLGRIFAYTVKRPRVQKHGAIGPRRQRHLSRQRFIRFARRQIAAPVTASHDQQLALCRIVVSRKHNAVEHKKRRVVAPRILVPGLATTARRDPRADAPDGSTRSGQALRHIIHRLVVKERNHCRIFETAKNLGPYVKTLAILFAGGPGALVDFFQQAFGNRVSALNRDALPMNLLQPAQSICFNPVLWSYCVPTQRMNTMPLSTFENTQINR